MRQRQRFLFNEAAFPSAGLKKRSRMLRSSPSQPHWLRYLTNALWQPFWKSQTLVQVRNNETHLLLNINQDVAPVNNIFCTHNNLHCRTIICRRHHCCEKVTVYCQENGDAAHEYEKVEKFTSACEGGTSLAPATSARRVMKSHIQMASTYSMSWNEAESYSYTGQAWDGKDSEARESFMVFIFPVSFESIAIKAKVEWKSTTLSSFIICSLVYWLWTCI